MSYTPDPKTLTPREQEQAYIMMTACAAVVFADASRLGRDPFKAMSGLKMSYDAIHEKWGMDNPEPSPVLQSVIGDIVVAFCQELKTNQGGN
jgi:hypothetical protein